MACNYGDATAVHAECSLPMDSMRCILVGSCPVRLQPRCQVGEDQEQQGIFCGM